MRKETFDPRVAALWILQGHACANLLRAHGKNTHAEHCDEAMQELMNILAEQIGASRLAEAIDWVTEQTWSDLSPLSCPAAKN